MQVDIGGNHGGRGPAHARKDCPMLSGRLLHRQVLQIIGKDKGGDPPVAKRYAHRPVSNMTDLRRNGRRRYKRPGHVLEHRLQIKFLLVMGANGGSRLLSRDSQHWHVVQPCVVKTSEQVRSEEHTSELQSLMRISYAV